MRPVDLISQELYQVNLVLWMLQPSTGHIVKPILAKSGFTVRDIEVELPLDLSLKNRLLADQVEASDPVTPDVVLSNSKKEFVLIECKSRMFGSDRHKPQPSSQVKQARSLLLQVPRILASALGLPPRDARKTFVAYLSSHDPSAQQGRGLAEIDEDLQAKKYHTTVFGLLTLSVKGDAVVIMPCAGGSLHDHIKRVFSKKPVKVHDLTGSDTDPRPLYIIPWMPNGCDEADQYGQAVFGNRVLSAVAARVGLCKPPQDIELEMDVLLDDATQGYYRRWRKKSVRKALSNNAKKLIKGVLDKSAAKIPVEAIGNPSRGWKISIQDEAMKSDLVEGLRKWQTEKWNQRPEPTLFDPDEQEV